MRKWSILTFLLFIISLPSFAQTTLYAGLNGAGSTNVGFWGINPTVEIEHNISSHLNADVRLNGFFDLSPDRELLPNIEVNDYHRSFYSDLGLNVQLINRSADWSIGAGGSYQIGSEQYLSGVGYYGGQLTDYQIEKTDFSRFGVYIRNTLAFGRRVSLNVTVYRFNYWGDYLSFGPSFTIN